MMKGAVEAAFMVGAGGKGSYKDRRIYAYIDDDPRSAFVPPYVISHAWRCNGGGAVIPATRFLPAREIPLRPPKLFRNDLIIYYYLSTGMPGAASGSGPRLKYGFGGDLQYRCENYAKFSIRTVAGVWPAEEPYLYSLHSIRPEFAVDLHPNLLSGTRTSAQTAHIRPGEGYICIYCV